MMKITIFTLLVIVLAIALPLGGVFSLIPQPIGLMQWAYMLAVVAIFLILLGLHLTHHGKYALRLFFFSYPFLTQSVHYINISSAFFILTPPLLYLLVSVFLTMEQTPSKGLVFVYLFCLSTAISILIARNSYTAVAFWILAVGSFAIMAYLTHSLIIRAEEPLDELRWMLWSIVLGSAAYLLIETGAFNLGARDIILIFTRQWAKLPIGRYYTGGYREPAGMGFVFSLLFWPILYLSQRPAQPRRRWQGYGVLALTSFLLFISGTRAALFSLTNTFIVLWLQQKAMKIKPLIAINWRAGILIFAGVALAAWLLVPRTFRIGPATTMSANPQEIARFTVLGTPITLVGTSAMYLNRTMLSLRDMLQNPLGSGPMNAPIPAESSEGGLGYYYSFISNLIVVAATFGWVSLLLLLQLMLYLVFSYFHIRRGNLGQPSPLFGLGVVFLAVWIASFLPGSYFIGPHLNWGGFNYYTPLTMTTSGLPTEYPSLISGMIAGIVTGILNREATEKTNTGSPA